MVLMGTLAPAFPSLLLFLLPVYSPVALVALSSKCLSFWVQARLIPLQD